jgi:hypothetical protein
VLQGAICSIPFFPLILGAAYYFFGAVRVPYPQLANLIAINLAVLICIGCGMAVGTFFNSIIVNPYPKKARPSRWQQRPTLLSEATFFDAMLLGDRLLVLRGIDDEASLTLAFGAATNRLMRIVYNFAMGRTMAWLLAPLFILTFLNDWARSYFDVISAAIVLIALLALLVPGLMRAAFGRELAFGATRCDANHESSPDSLNVAVTTLQNSGKEAGLFHSLYQNPDAPTIIARWVVNKMNENAERHQSN